LVLVHDAEGMLMVDDDELTRLKSAASVLARVHTRDDREIGFVVDVGATPGWLNSVSQGEWIDAWRTIRSILGMPSDPPASPLPEPPK
jgi:hypothetical protein